MKAATHRIHSIWIQLSVIMLGLLFSYWGTIRAMVDQWLHNDDFSHGLLILPISAYMAWERRNTIETDKLGSDWRALPILLAAMAMYIVGELGAELFTIRLSLLIFFMGALGLLFGPHLIKRLLFPLLFLLLMLPLPGFIYSNLTFPLQILSSKWAVAFLNLAGVLAFREGNVIDLGFTRLQVVEACNGLRFILPLFTLGVLFAFWKYKPLWKRLVLVVATVPIAITANILRIGGTGVLSKYWGEEAAQGFFHGFSGWAVFMLSFALFLGLNWLLGLVPAPRPVAPSLAQAQDDNESTAPRNIQRAAYAYAPLAVLLVLILSAPVLVGHLGNVAPQKLRQPLSGFPLRIDQRVGQIQTMDPVMWERVGGQAYFMADYQQAGTAPINFYVAYYESQRKAGDFIHSPRLCLPGAGWFIDRNHTRTLVARNGDDKTRRLQINELTIRKGESAELVYFWYQGRGRNFTSEYAAKFWMVWDGIWRRRTDGALVRVIMPLAANTNPDNARQTMDRFALDVANRLNDFLP